ncbi:MAG TPA: toll/interleukin-1 receptor domain-containing protein [Thermoanaerobaculia bacterium]|nr:toll/interleukin-1 receptor domain-containing protein [Thermoanaerobaculia bacterium]
MPTPSRPWLKVFISYSANDEFMVRNIVDQLNARGVETYCSAMDSQVGDGIVESVEKNLADADHFLVLLTPNSIKSDWVKIEIGAALFREKKMRIVPILMYLDRNRIPKPIDRLQIVSLDIKDIDRYYDEVAGWRSREPVVGRKVSAQEKVLARRAPGEAAREQLDASFLEQLIRQGVYANTPELEDIMRVAGLFARTSPPVPKEKKRRPSNNGKPPRRPRGKKKGK